MALIDWPEPGDASWAQAALGASTFALARLFATGGVLWTVSHQEQHGGAGPQPAATEYEITAQVVDISGVDLGGTDALALAPIADWHIYLEEWPDGATEPQLIAAGDVVTSVADATLRFRVTTVRPDGRYLDGDLEPMR